LGCNWSYLKAKVLSLLRVGRARNYPLWLSFQEINKTGLMHG